MMFGLNSWTTGDGVDLLTDLRVAAAAGYDFLEVKNTKIEQALARGIGLPRIRQLVREAGIRILNVNTLDQATLADAAELDELARRCRTMCEYAAALDAPYVIVGPTYLAEGQTPDRAIIRERTVRSLARFAAEGRAAGVKIAFEFHGYARASINTLAETLRVLGALDDPGVVPLVDTFHFYVGQSDIGDLRALKPDRLAAVHLADVDHPELSRLGRDNRVLPGHGVMPMRSITQALGEIGFSGPYTVELFRRDYWAMDPAEVATMGIAAMRSVL